MHWRAPVFAAPDSAQPPPLAGERHTDEGPGRMRRAPDRTVGADAVAGGGVAAAAPGRLAHRARGNVAACA